MTTVGLKNLAKQIITPEEVPLLFMEDSGAAFEYPLPQINGVVTCKECGAKNDWHYVDHDWEQPNSDVKWASFRCEGRIYKDCGTYYKGQGHPVIPNQNTYYECQTVIRVPIDERTKIKE